MSVATCLGVDDPERPALRLARDRWRHWCSTEPALSVVTDVRDLPQWLRPASPPARDEVLSALARVASRDPQAVSVLTWLLLPGAVAVARQLADLSPDIDALVAGQLWLAVREYDGRPCRRVAAALLARTRREVMAELGVGDAGRRRDRAWSSVARTGSVPEVPLAHDEPDPERELADLFDEASEVGALAREDRLLLLEVAHEAVRLGAPPRRGRGGLTTPSVAESVATHHPVSARTVRRRTASALDALGAFARSTR
ncbi:MAG TPA: hypothetical protein PLD23_16020 [Armatimonadota bacterium]|nr:hypothetical protein [Dermatophilaceae bacterium]HQK95016.1 hypothetical protein [Armatimonadota bacterium]